MKTSVYLSVFVLILIISKYYSSKIKINSKILNKVNTKITSKERSQSKIKLESQSQCKCK